MHVGRRPFARARNQACLSSYVVKLCCVSIPRYSRIWENESVRKYTRARSEDTHVRSKHTKYISVIYSRSALSTQTCAFVARPSGLKIEGPGAGAASASHPSTLCLHASSGPSPSCVFGCRFRRGWARGRRDGSRDNGEGVSGRRGKGQGAA